MPSRRKTGSNSFWHVGQTLDQVGGGIAGKRMAHVEGAVSSLPTNHAPAS
jgi:hypothetical protein